MADRSRVLIVDDDEPFRSRLCRSFELRGWEALPAADGRQANAVAARTGFDLAVIDLRISAESGLDVVRSLRAARADAAIIMLTGYGSIATAVDAVKSGADHYLSKPVDVDQILAVFQTLGSGPAVPAPPPAKVPSLARVEWEHMQRVLTDCGGNVSQAAKLLGMHRRSLQRKLSKDPPNQ